MPKMKTRSSAKKRYRTNAKGALKRKKAFTSHILTKKPRKRKDTAPKPKRERKPRAKLSPEVKAAHAREAARRYYLKNKENIAARTKASYAIYYQNNREAVLAKGARRRDRIKTENIKKLYKGLVVRGVAPAVVELREPQAPPPSPTIEPQQVE